MTQLGPQIGWPAQCECNTAHARSRIMSEIVNTVATEAPLWFRENIGLPRLINRLQKWLSIEMLLDDLRQIVCSVKSPNWFRSVASDDLTNIYKRRVSLNRYKKGANKFGRKISFKIENESEDQNQSSPKLVGILTVLRCIFRSKFGDSSLNGWWVMVRISSKWGKIWLSS